MIGPRIAALRRQAQMSQAELARKLKISPSAVGMYEQGRREPSAELLVNMAGIFQVSTDFLLTGRSPREDGVLQKLIQSRLDSAENRRHGGLSREELLVLVTALLMEP